VGRNCEKPHLTGGNRAKFAAMKVPRHCPFVLLVKVIWDKRFESEEGGDEKWKNERS
jgi:hypothetical protein